MAARFIFGFMTPAWNRLRMVLFNWELWPFALRYLFIMPMWAWYCLRARSLWFFTPSNPTITFGGFEGEGKREMYDLLPAESYPKTVFIEAGSDFALVQKAVRAAGLSYPFCVKPDVGMKGLLFRKIDSEAALRYYHERMPVTYMLQELVTYPLEVSVFYYRHPVAQQGVISGFIKKDLLEVVGDGTHTLLQLINAHPQASHRAAEVRLKHAAKLATVLPAGEHYPLSYAANLSRGARFTNLGRFIDAQLLQVFDTISHNTQFYYGRYDIKCQSIADLKNGRRFSILEYNGSGAEPNHVYNAGYSLLGAQRVFLHHWKMLYQISAYNNRNGVAYWPFFKGLRFLRGAKKHLRVLEACDAQIHL